MPNSNFTPFAGTAPKVASYVTPGGQAVTNGAVPQAGTGQGYWNSSPLIYNANGSAQTAAGTVNNPFQGFKSAQGGGFGATDAGGYLSILGGQPGQYDALAGRLAADPNLKTQWQGILQNDPTAINAAMTGGDADLSAIASSYANRLGSDSDFLAAHGGQNPFAPATATPPVLPTPAGTVITEPSPINSGAAPANVPPANISVLPHRFTGLPMIPSTANPAQTPQAQGPNPLIPFYSGRQTGFTMGAPYNSAGPQQGTGFGAAPAPSGSTITEQAPGLTGTNSGPNTDPNGPYPGKGTGAPGTGLSPIGAQALQNGFTGGYPAAGGSGVRGGSTDFGFPRFQPIGYPFGEDPRRKRRIDGGLGAPGSYAPLASAV